jgi:hypothetical protein
VYRFLFLDRKATRCLETNGELKCVRLNRRRIFYSSSVSTAARALRVSRRKCCVRAAADLIHSLARAELSLQQTQSIRRSKRR